MGQQRGLRIVHADADPPVAVHRLVRRVVGDQPREPAVAGQADPGRAVRRCSQLHRRGRSRLLLGDGFERGARGARAVACADPEGDGVAVQVEAAGSTLPGVLALLQPVEAGDAQHAEGCGERGEALIVPRLPFGGELFHEYLRSSGSGVCVAVDRTATWARPRCPRPGRHPRAPLCEIAGCAVHSSGRPVPAPPAARPRPPGPTVPRPVPLRPGGCRSARSWRTGPRRRPCSSSP